MTDSNIEATQSTEPPTRSKFFAGRTLSDGKTIVWWREILIIAAVNVVYETVRNLSAGKPSKAYSNALLIIDWQRNLGIWHEQAMQQFALGFTPLIVVANHVRHGPMVTLGLRVALAASQGLVDEVLARRATRRRILRT